MTFLVALLEALFGHLLGQEISARWPKLMNALLNFAVRQLPEYHRDEMRDEWATVLEDIEGPVTKLAHALDFVRAAWWTAFQEYRVANRRDWAIFDGTMQVLAGASGIWLIERLEAIPSVKSSKVFRWVHLGLLTIMVKGLGRHAEAYLTAADRFAELGNDTKETESRSEAEKLGKQVMDRIVDVGLIYALHQMADEHQSLAQSDARESSDSSPPT